jgi:O-antigen/teichoic acid export membrane protein
MDSTELKTRTLYAVLWAVVRIGASNVLGFVLFMVLARVLSPRDFGVFALAILVIDVAKVVAAAGLGDAVTRDEADDEILADTTFWAGVCMGCIAGGLAWVLAPLYARLIGQPELTAALHCLALLVPIAALGNIHTARKLRAFGHKSLAARTVACSSLGGAAAVAAAVAGLGVWSLIIQAAIVEIVGTVFAWQSYPWWPRLRFDRRRLASVSIFSLTMLLTQLAGTLITRIQDVVIGRYISVDAVGTYRIAWRMIDLIAQTTVQPVVSVAFVTLAHLQNERERFRSALLRMVGLAALVTLPAITGFGALAGDIIPLLFGAKWASSAAIAQVLSLMAVPFCINLFLGSALAAMGRPASIAKSITLQTVAALALALLAAPFGIEWIAGAYVLRAYLTLPYHLVLFNRDTGADARSMLRSIAPPFVAAELMAVALWLVTPALHSVLGHGIAFVAVAVLLGGVVFAGALLLGAQAYVRANFGFLLLMWRGQHAALTTRGHA